MTIAEILLEYFKVLFSPHITIGGVIIFFLVKFKTGIQSALARLSSFKGPVGVEATFDAQALGEKDQQKLIETRQEVEAAQREGQTGQHLEMMQNLLLKITDWWMFEKIYRSIYKSQIKLLWHLRSLPNRQATWIDLFTFYQQGVLSLGIGGANYPYENYMNYLAINGLITWENPSGTNQTIVSLTPKGVDFIQYLADNNYNVEERPF